MRMLIGVALVLLFASRAYTEEVPLQIPDIVQRAWEMVKIKHDTQIAPAVRRAMLKRLDLKERTLVFTGIITRSMPDGEAHIVVIEYMSEEGVDTKIMLRAEKTPSDPDGIKNAKEVVVQIAKDAIALRLKTSDSTLAAKKLGATVTVKCTIIAAKFECITTKMKAKRTKTMILAEDSTAQ